jgi:hypothetical protein
MKPRFDIWQTDRENAKQVGNLKILKGGNEDRPTVKIWRGKAFKPYANYYFPNMIRREQFIRDAVKAEEERQATKEKYKQDRKGSPELLEQVKPGTIFSCSWGYDQTNVDFYQVVERRGYMVTLREIGCKSIEETSWASDKRIAVKDAFLKNAEPFKKKLQFHNKEPYVSMNSYSSAYLWNGEAKHCSWYA